MKKYTFSSLVSSLNPALEKIWLYLLAGVLWSGVGIYLCALTIDWFQPVEPVAIFFLVVGGFILAYLIFRFGFSGFARRNILRVESFPNKKVCIFAFQQWTSYPLVIFMISLGIFLRKFSPFPKPFLGVMYLGIGGSLFLASFLYYQMIFTRIEDG